MGGGDLDVEAGVAAELPDAEFVTVIVSSLLEKILDAAEVANGLVAILSS